jgi:hypothetical protein
MKTIDSIEQEFARFALQPKPAEEWVEINVLTGVYDDGSRDYTTIRVPKSWIVKEWSTE